MGEEIELDFSNSVTSDSIFNVPVGLSGVTLVGLIIHIPEGNRDMSCAGKHLRREYRSSRNVAS